MFTVNNAYGDGFKAGDSVQLSPATDWWMRGAKFGTVLAVRKNGQCTVKLDRGPKAQVHVDLLQAAF